MRRITGVAAGGEFHEKLLSHDMDPPPERSCGPDPVALPRAARLVRLPDGESHLIFNAPVTMGRDPSSVIRVDEDDVSRNHAYLLRTPQGYMLVDSSLHGTFVNGDRVQAQWLLSDGDVVQVGVRSFRFELRRHDPGAEADDGDSGLLMTSERRLGPSSAAVGTGKLKLALALDEHTPRGSRLKIWIRRYGLSELAGVAMAIFGSWLLRSATDSSLAAAYGASIGEAMGFYGSLVAREMLQEAYAAGARRAPYGLRQMAGTWRGLFLEFGPAELLDTGVIRPLAMGVGTKLLGPGLGILAGKLVADLTFYLPVIYTYERRKSRG